MEVEMADPVVREGKVVVERERGGAGGVIAAIALLILVLGILKFMGMLPF
jgi:hypothetical protein